MNQLGREKSPYLLQHAHNPVDWYPWGGEAFDKARRENKPVFVSIGYSTCHWCHVMERESFEDQTLADRLNRDFVAIKVDREERPDIDHTYMTFVTATTGSGGWPLSVFVTPEGKPFYGGTYFAPDRRYGRPGFGEVLDEIARVFKEQRGEVEAACGGFLKFLESRAEVDSRSALAEGEIGSRVWAAMREGFDAEWGGWGGSPKFPMPFNLVFLLSHARWAKEPHAAQMALKTLRRMAEGGIWDAAGGGFHRYAVDRRWQVPHFEKMLYDQAGILEACLWAHRFSGEELYLSLARDIVRYVSRDLKSETGAFFGAEDADSAPPENPSELKREGAFYLWKESELQALLAAEEFELLKRVYGIRGEGNIEADPHGEFEGLNILSRVETEKALSGAGEAELRLVLEKLRIAREKRPRPSRDTKVLADWNGLWIAALAHYGAVSGSAEAIREAEAAAEFFWGSGRDGSGRFWKRWADGEWAVAGQLEDHAFLFRAFWKLFEVTGQKKWFRRSVETAERTVADFWRGEVSGFAMTVEGNDPLLPARPMEFTDGVIPSANALMLVGLVRLSRRTGRRDWDPIIHALSRRWAAEAAKSPTSCCTAAWAEGVMRETSLEITVGGASDGLRQNPFTQIFFKQFLPEADLLIAGAPEGVGPEDLPGFPKELLTGNTRGMICRDRTCGLPISDPAAWIAALDQLKTPLSTRTPSNRRTN